MFIVCIMIAVWGMDIFLLPRYVKVPFNIRFSKTYKILFSCCLSLFLLTLVQVIALRVFSSFFIAILGFYILSKKKAETAFYGKVYYEDREAFRHFLTSVFFSILLQWFWGVLLLSAGIRIVVMMIPALGSDLGGISFLSLAAGFWMLFLIRCFLHRCPVYSFRELLGLSQEKKGLWVDWTVPILFGVIIAVASSYLFVYRLQQPVTPFSELLDWADTSRVLAVFLFIAVFLAPFLEEVIFRGFFFKMIQECKNSRWAFWLVGASFGFLHMEQYWGDWTGIIIVFLLGFLLTAFRYFSGSAHPGIVLHYTFNILMVIVPGVMFVVSHPAFTQYHIGRKEISVEQKEHLLQESIREDEKNAMAYNELAWLYLENDGSLNQALMSVEKALKIMPKRTIFQHTRAEVLYAMGREGEAIVILEDILQKMPENQEILNRLNEMKLPATSVRGVKVEAP